MFFIAYIIFVDFKGEVQALVTRVSPLEDEKLFCEKVLSKSGGFALLSPLKFYFWFSKIFRGGEAVAN